MEKGSPEELIDRLLREEGKRVKKGKTGSLTETPSTPVRDRYDLIPPIREKPLLNNFKIEPKIYLKNNF